MEIKDIPGFDRVITFFESAISERRLSKTVLSRPRDKSVLRAQITLFEKNGALSVAVETFMCDGKAIRKNHPANGASLADTARLLTETALLGYKQINTVCSDCTCEILVSDKGKLHISEKKRELREIAVPKHDKQKQRLLVEGEKYPFLIKLGVSSADGRIYDKKQAKFRQINKFLEQIDAVYRELPASGELCICDLCCGKSYLTFAAYWYFSEYRERKVMLYGVDLKKDVIDYCNKVSAALGWNGMHFEAGDVSRFSPPSPPDMVISLHACDVATDYVLAGAIRNGARVILSTPCCHHELNGQIKSDALELICKHSMLKQKLADALTDGLRSKMLEAYGYDVTVCELIDPEETPKNILIRAVKRSKSVSNDKKAIALSEYDSVCRLFGVAPKLRELLRDASSQEQSPQSGSLLSDFAPSF